MVAKALVAMSGGVDSSVAAYLTKQQGYECIGCTMKLYENADACVCRSHTCCSLDDVDDARQVAYRLDMPHYVFNFADDFREKVIHKFVRFYQQGMTPNPCIDCNRYMKFARLFDRAQILGCDHVVTGHYARITVENGQYYLRKALDPTKDQSYVLYSMTQWQLAHTLFPLGGLTKSAAREIAAAQGFVNAQKPDSQDICFVPDGDYAKVVEAHAGAKSKPGDFIDPEGKVIGRHRGIIHYTIGQRHGLGIAAPERLFVCDINAAENTVTVGTLPHLASRGVIVKEFNWISGTPPAGEIACQVKIRYRQQEQPAHARVLDDGLVEVIFADPQNAVTPGQAAVLYDGDIVLGGGEIVGRI